MNSPTEEPHVIQLLSDIIRSVPCSLRGGPPLCIATGWKRQLKGRHLGSKACPFPSLADSGNWRLGAAGNRSSAVAACLTSSVLLPHTGACCSPAHPARAWLCCSRHSNKPVPTLECHQKVWKDSLVDICVLQVLGTVASVRVRLPASTVLQQTGPSLTCLGCTAHEHSMLDIKDGTLFVSL